MNLRIYLLHTDLSAWENAEEDLMQTLYARVDETRQAKADRIRTPKAKLTSLAAGLLLQKMLRDGMPTKCDEKPVRLTIEEMLLEIEEPLPMQFAFGENGKPYLKDSELHFSLSHSGDYILLAVSDQEIGADIQEKQSKDVVKLANRFFAPEEAQYLGILPLESQRDYFYHLWTAKEACTKLLGDVLGQHLADDIESAKDVLFLELKAEENYSAVVCYSAT